MSENKMKVHYMSDKHTWETPQEFFDLLNEEFNLKLILLVKKKLQNVINIIPKRMMD